MIIFFSGTGNSRYCAEKIALITDDECVDAAKLIKEGIKGKFVSEKPYIIVAPTYAWRIPIVFELFIKNADFSGERKAYFIMTCGDDTGNAQEKNKALCEEKGLEYMGSGAIKMPENYIAMFPVPEEKRCKEIMSEAEDEINLIAAKISAGKELEKIKAGFGDNLKTGLINSVFYKLFVNSGAFYAKENCISCGKCANLCPMNTVSLKDGKPVWGKNCTHCMACISYCPTQAIEYGKRTVGKRRYRCE